MECYNKMKCYYNGTKLMLIFVIKTTRPPSQSTQMAQRLWNNPVVWAVTSWRKIKQHCWDLSTRRQTEMTTSSTVVSCILSWSSQSVSYIDHCRGWTLAYWSGHHDSQWRDQEWEGRTTYLTNIWLGVCWRYLWGSLLVYWSWSEVYLQLNCSHSSYSLIL